MPGRPGPPGMTWGLPPAGYEACFLDLLITPAAPVRP